MVKRQEEMKCMMIVIRHFQMVLMVMMVMQWQVGSSQEITVNTDGGYEGVLVAIGKELDQTKCLIYVNNIKTMMNNASTLLHSATRERLFFSSVTILIPEDWTDCGNETIGPAATATFEEAHIRVQQSHPFFLDNPWTQQPRPCGEEGDFMYFSDTYFSATSPELGSQDKVFVHEWAKFRWGVFEEYGHAGDGRYPSAYRDSNAEWQPNYCTDGSVQGTMTGCTEESSESECSFVPYLEQSTNITSSLLAVPFVDSVNTFCDENNHNTTVPTKHNFLCGKKSTWSIISQHSDITNTNLGTIKGNTTYIIQNAAASVTKDRLVFLLDTTVEMGAVFSRWEYLRDAVRQFIEMKAADGSQVGVILFNNTPQPPLLGGLVTLDSQNNGTALAKAIPDDCPCENAVKNVGLAIEAAVQLLGNSGKIILITENVKEHTAEDPMGLVNRAAGLSVQPILYPVEPNVPTILYEAVAELSGLAPRTVDNIKDGASQSVESYSALSKFIENAGRDTLTEVDSRSCSTSTGIRDCVFELSIDNIADFEPNFFIETLRDVAIPSPFITFEVTDPSGNIMDKIPPMTVTSSDIFEGSNLKSGRYSVNVTINKGENLAYASLVAIKKSMDHPFSLVVSASKPLSALNYVADPPSAPIIYATLSSGTQSIVFAEVTATIRNAISGVVNNFNLTLNDNGIGGDVTGNDGIYSAYLIGVTEIGLITISMSANDNNGTARIVTTAPPVNTEGLKQSCCGNSLDLPEGILVETGTFSVTSAPGINGEATGTIPSNFPPGRVIDLSATRVEETVSISFTATGEDYDEGQATSYKLNYDLEGVGHTKDLNISAAAGELISTSMTLDTCDVVYTLTVTAVDSEGLDSQPSNEVRVIDPCGPVSTPGTLSAGAIVGIVIGCLLLLIIIIIIIYLCINRDDLDDLRLWQILTCRCTKKKNKSKKTSHLFPSRTGRSHDVVRGNVSGPTRETREVYGGNVRSSNPPAPIRGIEDLYGKPDLEAKWKARNKKQADSDSDGGFRDRNVQQGNIRMGNSGDNSSLASSVPSRVTPSSMPGNQVGIPLAHNPYQGQSQYNARQSMHDNYGYTDSESGAYPSHQYDNRIRKPILPPLKSRVNTQV